MRLTGSTEGKKIFERRIFFSINSLQVLQLYIQINNPKNGQVKGKVHRLMHVNLGMSNQIE